MKVRVLASALVLVLVPGLVSADDAVRLKSRIFVPEQSLALLESHPAPAPGEVVHLLVQPIEGVRADRAALRDRGVTLLQYVPDGTWIARVDARAWVAADLGSALRWLGRLEPGDKMPARIAQGRVGDWALDPDGRARVRVRGHRGVAAEELRAALLDAGAEPIRALPLGAGWLARIETARIPRLAEADVVLWVSEDLPEPQVENDGTRARVNADDVQGPPYDLTGFGVIAGIMDGGAVSDAHPDFAGRLTNVDGPGAFYHATHVAGTLGGSGLNSEIQGGSALQWRGVAPDVTLVTSDYYGDVLADFEDAVSIYGVEVHSNSWGFGVNNQNCEIYGDYDFLAPDLDSLVTGSAGRKVPFVFSAGNERDDGDCPLLEGQYGCINPPKASKNALIVGATNSDNDTMTEFSSWGPTDDGRLKPDVTAPGCEEGGEGFIKSTLPVDAYGGNGWCGTSMAAPVGSGAIALLRQAFDSTYVGQEPEPSLFRALLAATAVDLGNPGPDYAFGHGRIDIERAAHSLLGDTPFFESIEQDDVVERTFVVVGGTRELRAVLAWDDPPAAPVSDPALVNDLDLVLVSPSEQVYEPWILDPDQPSLDAVRGVDTRNNMEQVSVAFPQAGTWRAIITGTNVPQGPQLASLVGLDGAGPDAPSDVVLVEATDSSVSFTWTEDRPFDFTGTLVARYQGSTSWGGPVDGQVFLEGQLVAPGTQIVYNRSEDHSSSPWVNGGLAANSTYTYVFYSFDDARIYSDGVLIEASTLPVSSAPLADAVVRLELSAPRPNPASSRAEIRFAVPRAGLAQLRVFDPAGRRVRTLLDAPVDAGRHQLVWDGRDDAGNLLGSGLFLLELRAGGERRTQRVNWTR